MSHEEEVNDQEVVAVRCHRRSGAPGRGLAAPTPARRVGLHPGVLSGNVVQIPNPCAVNACGNTISVIGCSTPLSEHLREPVVPHRRSRRSAPGAYPRSGRSSSSGGAAPHRESVTPSPGAHPEAPSAARDHTPEQLVGRRFTHPVGPSKRPERHQWAGWRMMRGAAAPALPSGKAHPVELPVPTPPRRQQSCRLLARDPRGT